MVHTHIYMYTHATEHIHMTPIMHECVTCVTRLQFQIHIQNTE